MVHTCGFPFISEIIIDTNGDFRKWKVRLKILGWQDTGNLLGRHPVQLVIKNRPEKIVGRGGKNGSKHT